MDDARAKSRPRWLATLARFGITVVLAAICFGIDRAIHAAFVDLVYNTIIRACVWAMLAASLNLVNGVTGQFSLGHAAFAAIGAYAGGLFSIRLQPLLIRAHLAGWRLSAAQIASFLAAMIIGAILAAAAGFLVGLPSLRLRGDYLAIATLGFGEIVRVIFQAWDVPFGGSTGMTGVPQRTTLCWALLAFIGCVILLRNLQWSGPGRDMLAVREDEIAAGAVGVDVVRAKVVAFITAASLAGVAGVVLVHLDRVVDPTQAGFMNSILIVVMVVLGGSGSLTGSIVGAFLITGLLAAFDGIPMLNSVERFKNVVFPFLLLLMILVRREGLLGRKELSWRTYGYLFRRLSRKGSM